jgi:hypothetical protein
MSVSTPSSSTAPSAKEGVWTKIGVVVAVAALLLTYLGVAVTAKWWPFSTSSHTSSSGQPMLVSIPKSIPYCNIFGIHGTVPPNKVMLLFDRLVDKSNAPIQGHNYDFDRAAISTSNGWTFMNVEIGAGVSSDNGDHHEIAVVLLDQAEYPAFKSTNELDLTVLPGTTVQYAYVVRNSIHSPCPVSL